MMKKYWLSLDQIVKIFNLFPPFNFHSPGHEYDKSYGTTIQQHSCVLVGVIALSLKFG